jgi:hypothetical protein
MRVISRRVPPHSACEFTTGPQFNQTVNFGPRGVARIDRQFRSEYRKCRESSSTREHPSARLIFLTSHHHEPPLPCVLLWPKARAETALPQCALRCRVVPQFSLAPGAPETILNEAEDAADSALELVLTHDEPAEGSQ